LVFCLYIYLYFHEWTCCDETKTGNFCIQYKSIRVKVLNNVLCGKNIIIRLIIRRRRKCAANYNEAINVQNFYKWADTD
jgi:hypothetical protein